VREVARTSVRRRRDRQHAVRTRLAAPEPHSTETSRSIGQPIAAGRRRVLVHLGRGRAAHEPRSAPPSVRASDRLGM